MGDRALVVFSDGRDVSPVVYLHWNGTEVPEWLEEHKYLMGGRMGDVSYAVARFIGICHIHIHSNMSLGCFTASNSVKAAARAFVQGTSTPEQLSVLENFSHGDAGVVVVNVLSGSWRGFGGYHAQRDDPQAMAL